MYWSALALYALSYVLPATFTSRITAWGWQAALYSLVPLLMAAQDPADRGAWLMVLVFSTSNVAFIAAAILAWLRRRRAALACAAASLASMVYGGVSMPFQQSELVGGPAGHLGPGYYAWVIAGMLLIWTAFSSPSAR